MSNVQAIRAPKTVKAEAEYRLVKATSNYYRLGPVNNAKGATFFGDLWVSKDELGAEPGEVIVTVRVKK